MGKRIREQASKRDRAIRAAASGNAEMGEAFRELRKGSRTSPHRNLTKYNRNDARKARQRGEW